MKWQQVFYIPRFCYAVYKWILIGCQTRSIKDINYIYDNICTPCEHFDKDVCNICWCNVCRDTKVFNKLALKNMCCPDNPPRWK